MDRSEGAGKGPKIEFHADDYGLFPAQSQRILDCYRRGRLNGISILPNSRDLPGCMAMLGSVPEDLAVTVHLNLIEGRCLADPGEVPLLADGNGVFRGGFGRLLLRSYLPGREKLRAQLKKEFSAQIQAVRPYLPQGTPLRLDGHAHYHMLPVAFDAMMDVIREEGLPVGYIRIPREELGLYWRHRRELKDFSPINVVKVLILNILAGRNQRKYGAYLNTLEQKLFLGVFLSGRMYRENVERILPEAERLAGEQKRNIEILAHPGGVYEAADIARLTNDDDISFLTSKARDREARMFDRQEG